MRTSADTDTDTDKDTDTATATAIGIGIGTGTSTGTGIGTGAGTGTGSGIGTGTDRRGPRRRIDCGRWMTGCCWLPCSAIWLQKSSKVQIQIGFDYSSVRVWRKTKEVGG